MAPTAHGRGAREPGGARRHSRRRRVAAGSLTIGLVFEDRAAIRARAPAHVDDELLYHWREPAEIEAVTAALRALGHRVEQIGAVDALLARGHTVELVFN